MISVSIYLFYQEQNTYHAQEMYLTNLTNKNQMQVFLQKTVASQSNNFLHFVYLCTEDKEILEYINEQEMYVPIQQ